MTRSMRSVFTQHHRLSDEELSKLWASCTFVLDANVLLNIYRYADSTREDLFKVLSGLKGRVWVPFQAAREFYRRRIDVIQEQHAKYDEAIDALGQSLKSIHHGGLKKSAFLHLDDLASVIQPAIQEAQQRVRTQQNAHPDLLLQDTYLERLAEIVGDGIGDEIDEKAFEERCKDAQVRIDLERPHRIP